LLYRTVGNVLKIYLAINKTPQSVPNTMAWWEIKGNTAIIYLC